MYLKENIVLYVWNLNIWRIMDRIDCFCLKLKEIGVRWEKIRVNYILDI